MKKLIIAAAVFGLGAMGIQSAKASDLGKFLDGALAIHLAAIHSVADVVHDVTPRVNVNLGPAQPVYCPPAPRVVYIPAPPPRVIYYQPARAYYPPRVVVYPAHDHRGGYRR